MELMLIGSMENTYYDNPKENTAFECCIDIMSRLILKYEIGYVEKAGSGQYKRYALRRNSSCAMIHTSQCVEEQKYGYSKKNNGTS